MKHDVKAATEPDKTILVGISQYYRGAKIKVSCVNGLLNLGHIGIDGFYAGPHRIPDTGIHPTKLHLEFLALI